MGCNGWKSFIQSPTLLGLLLFLPLLFAIRPSYANSIFCEQSHLTLHSAVSLNDLISAANQLAQWRLSIQRMKPSNNAKRLATEEFAQKFREFEIAVGSKEKALQLLQEQMNRAKGESQQAQQNELKDERLLEEQRQGELEELDPTNLTRKAQFHLIQPGEFQMGAKRNVIVKISQPYEMMDIPTTQMIWSRIQVLLGERDPDRINPSENKTRSKTPDPEREVFQIGESKVIMRPNHPVDYVSYHMVQEWIEGLNKLSTSDDPQIQKNLSRIFVGHQKGMIYDLPSEAEWEFVMTNRGHNYSAFFDRDDDQELQDYSEQNDFTTREVARLKPRLIDGHPFYDLEGNIREWVKDLSEGVLPGGTDPLPSHGNYGIVRGGPSGSYSSQNSSINYRELHTPLNQLRMGFRLIRRSQPRAAPIIPEKIGFWKKILGLAR